MHLLRNIYISIILLLTFYSVAKGNTIYDNYAAKIQGAVRPSVATSLLCGKNCNEDSNCAGFFIGAEGICTRFEHGQAPAAVDLEGVLYQKMPDQLPTLYESDESPETPRSCTEVKIRDGSLTTGGTYTIDPDGVGGEGAITVTCKTDDNLTFITEIGHNRGGWNGWTGPQADKIALQSYTWNITYNANNAQLHTLASISAACSMYVHFKCHSLNFNSIRWVAYDGSWYPLNVGTTHCPPDLGRACNCAAGGWYYASDYGSFNDKANFPVTGVVFGGLAYYYNMFEFREAGAMKCQDTPRCTKPPTILFATRDKTEQEVQAGFDHGEQVVYTCIPGLQYPSGETTMSLTCQMNQMWSGMDFTECD